MTTINKGTKVDTGNLRPGELIHVDFAFYNVTSLYVFTSMLTVIFAKNRMMWVFPTVSQRAHLCIIRFILTTLKNEQHPCKIIWVDEDGALENSTDVINLLIESFNIYMETTVGDSSWLNGKNKRHNISIHNIVRACLLYSNQHANTWWFAAETSAEVHRCKIYRALDNNSPHFAWYGKNPSIHELRKFVFDIYPIILYTKILDDRTQEG